MLASVIRKRVLQLPFVVLCVTFFTYILLNALPGNAATAIAGNSLTLAQTQRLARQLGLVGPVLDRYRHWLWSVLHGHFGVSLATSQPVLSVLGQRIPVTVELIVFALLIVLVLSIPLATIAAYRPGGIGDKLASTIAMSGLSIPNFVVALVLILLFADTVHAFPATGFVPLSAGVLQNLRSLVLPAVAISYLPFAIFTRVLATDMINTSRNEQFVVAGRARGLGELEILLRHVVRNSLFGFITVVGLTFGPLIGGSVIIEQLFDIPGTGQLLISSVNTRDTPMLEALVAFIAISVVLVNLIADVLYSVLDPRVRYVSRNA